MFFFMKCFCKNPKTESNRKIAKRSSTKECISYYRALHIECLFNKNSLLQSYFFSFFSSRELGRLYKG